MKQQFLSVVYCEFLFFVYFYNGSPLTNHRHQIIHTPCCLCTSISLRGFCLLVTVGRMLIPKIILISKKKRILDMPNARKVHSSQIPRLGGVAFFPAIMMAYWFVRGLFWQFNTFDAVVPFEDFLFFTTGLMLICIVGITDDISGLSYKCKFVFQVVGALLLVLPYCYIDNLQGLFGLYAIPAWAGVPFTLLLLVALVNAANLIDGVDGLCSGLGVLIFSVLSLLKPVGRQCPFGPCWGRVR